MTLGLVVQNTSNQAFTLNSIAGNIFSNDYRIGTVGSFIAQHISANSETTLYLKIRMELLGVVNNLINAFTTGNIQQKINLDAIANIDTLQVPVKLSYTVG